jgi:hypothetical protein
MTALEWDKVGDRRYETGIDRGVLFVKGGPAVPWNGLSSVTEAVGRDVKSYYLDGVKYLDHHVPGSYSAKLAAFTYPDELEELLGMREYVPGVFLHDQRAKLFNLSYRTLVGNDVEGTEYGYKVHIIYNVLAIPSDNAMNSLSDSSNLSPFEWELKGTPNLMLGVRPTAHISLDSRRIDPALLAAIELLLYGGSTTGTGTPDDPIVQNDPSLPSFIDLIRMLDAVEVPT